MRRVRRVPLALATAALLLLSVAPTRAEPVGDPIKVELPPPFEGAPDPPDPPTIAPPDPALATLDVPTQHPWMLFDAEDVPAIRERILGADPGSIVGRAWRELLAFADGCCDDRSSVEQGVADLGHHRWGRDDLALVGFVWHVTGDDRYLAKAKELLRYAVGSAPDHGAPMEPGVDEFYIQRAHRLNGFALAYDLLHPGLDEGERLALREIVAGLGRQHVAHSTTAWWGTISTGSNITGNNAAAIGTAGLALWHELPEVRSWVVRSDQLVRSYFHDGFDREGAGFEGVIYGNYGLRIATFLEQALSRAGRPGLFQTGGVDRQQEWFAYEILPGGGALNPINDARYYEVHAVYTAWATALGDTPALSRWIFDEAVPGVPHVDRQLGEWLPTLLWYEPSDPAFSPEQVLPLAKAFTDRGLVHVRSGWEAGDLMASFEARQNDWGEGVHHNQDVNSFTLYADGARLVVDSRYANWLSKMAARDREAARTSESEAHNYLVADGRSQDFHGKGDLTTFASTASVGRPGSLDVAVGDARLAWLTDQPERAERVFLHVRAHERRAGNPADDIPDYVVVADRFRQGGGAHDHTWFLHTEWENAMSLPGPGRMRVDAPGGAGMDVTLVSATPVDMAVGSFTPDDEEDWRSSGQPGPRTQDRLEVSGTGDAFHAIAVLVPTAAGAVGPAAEPLSADGGVAARVSHGAGATDVVLLGDDRGASASAAGVSADGAFAMVRTVQRRADRFTLVGGRRLAAGRTVLVELEGGTGTVVADGGRVDIVGADVTGFRVVTGPDALVTLNGVEVQTVRQGGAAVYAG